MALTDRIMHKGAQIDFPISIHSFSAAFMLYCTGDLTRAQVIAYFTLIGGDVTEFDALKAKYDSLATAIEKVAYIWKLESAGVLYENGAIDAVKYKTIMGF